MWPKKRVRSLDSESDERGRLQETIRTPRKLDILHDIYRAGRHEADATDAPKSRVQWARPLAREYLSRHTAAIARLLRATGSDRPNAARFLRQGSPAPADNCEIELSLGVYSNTGQFQPGVGTRNAFDAVHKRFAALGYEPVVSRTRVEHGRAWTRKITNVETGKEEYQRKIRKTKDHVNIPELGIRCSKSVEQRVSAAEHACDPRQAMVRHRSRTTYRAPPNCVWHPLWKGLRFDLTVVRHESGVGGRQWMTYEVEIEREHATVSAEALVDAAIFVHAWAQDTDQPENVMTSETKALAIADHNQLFGEASRDLYGHYTNHPISLKLGDLFEVAKEGWSVTVKLDGVRRFLFISASGTYLCAPPYDITKVGAGCRNLEGTLVDGEDMNREEGRTFFAFDVLFVKGRDLRRMNFAERLSVLESRAFTDDVSALLAKTNEIAFRVKPYHSGGTFYENTAAAFAETARFEAAGFGSDGLVFQPPRVYLNRRTLKWKPPGRITIDFYLKAWQPKKRAAVGAVEADMFELMASCGQFRDYVRFAGTARFPHDGFMTIKGGRFQGRSVAREIVECSVEDAKLLPVKIRDDKPSPNHIRTAVSVWMSRQLPITRDTIEGRSMKVFRLFSNQHKSGLLMRYVAPGSTILDIGTGRGGDMQKWKRLNVRQVFAVDPNAENLAEFARRRASSHAKGGPRVEVIHGCFEDTPAVAAVVKKVSIDVVVAFFCLTFLAKNSAGWNKLLASLCAFVPPTKKFIGMVLDGRRTRELLLGAKGVVSTPSFAISLETELSLDAPETLGDEIRINITDPDAIVKDQTEYLFYFDKLKRDLEPLGFVLDETGFLDSGIEFDGLPPDSQTYSKLTRWFSFTRASFGKGPPTRPGRRTRPRAAKLSAPSPATETVDEKKSAPPPTIAKKTARYSRPRARLVCPVPDTPGQIRAWAASNDASERENAKTCRKAVEMYLEGALQKTPSSISAFHAALGNGGSGIFRSLRELHADAGGAVAASPIDDVVLAHFEKLISPLKQTCSRWSSSIHVAREPLSRAVQTGAATLAGFLEIPPLRRCRSSAHSPLVIPCSDSSVDFAAVLDGLSYQADSKPALAELMRVLKPGGTFLLREHNCLSPTQRLFLATVRQFHRQIFADWPSGAGRCLCDAAAFRSAKAWKETIGAFGFAHVESVFVGHVQSLPKMEKSDLIRCFYSVYRRKK